MTRERELLQKILTDNDDENYFISCKVYKEIEELLAQPEQPNEPVVNSLAAELLHNKAWYQKGYGDAKQELKREPLSGERLAQLYLLSVDYDPYVFARQVEKAHGIGVDDE